MVNNRDYILIEVSELNHIQAQKYLISLGYIWNTGSAAIIEMDFKFVKTCLVLYKDEHKEKEIKKMFYNETFYVNREYYKTLRNYNYFVYDENLDLQSAVIAQKLGLL